MPLRTDKIILATATAKSGNAKIGDAAATYAAQASCPSYCAFFNGGGCYAENGQIYSSVTKRLNDDAHATRATALDVARAEADAIDRLPVLQCWDKPIRLHTVGDCTTDETAQIVAAAAERYMQRGGGPAWCYTHAWRIVDRASWGRVSVLASCETPEQVELARARGYATALVVEQFATDRLHDHLGGGGGTPHHSGKRVSSEGLTAQSRSSQSPRAAAESCRTASPTPSGVAASASALQLDAGALKGQRPGSVGAPVTSALILPCPQQTRGVSCTECRLCMNDAGVRTRGYSIGFEIHGTAFTVRQARAALRRPGDERRRLTLRELIPAYLAERPSATTGEIARELGYEYSSVAEMRAKLERAELAA